MVTELRPARGGFLRPFGTAIFIRDYLMGRGADYGVEAIDPERGAPIADIHRAYKRALHLDMAEDMAARDAEEAARRGKPMTSEEIERRRDYYLERIPSKLTRMRYSSFVRYFRFFIQLGWVERTGEVEGSIIGGPEDTRRPQVTPRGTVLIEVPQPRIYYSLTPKGREATLVELSDPVMTIYNYPREQRSKKKYKYFKTR
jgi:hypothetical protein